VNPESATGQHEDIASVRQAYRALLRHQPATNSVGYESRCAVCGQKAPCPLRRQAVAVLVTHGHNPFPAPAEVETALGLPPIG
jgi:hypothetical protein